MNNESIRKIRAIVVDDEPLPRAHITHLLSEAGLENIRQASSAAECLEIFAGDAEPPDWAFLDVQMPGMDGIALADALGAGHVSASRHIDAPSIVFVTGYEDYAIQAFERAAVDYLLKPVRRERLHLTLDRLAAISQSGVKPAPAVSMPAPSLQRLPIRMEYAVKLIDFADILAVTTNNKRIDVLTRDTVYSTYYSLSQLERRLPPDQFVRVHDAWIINLSEVVEIHNLGAQSYQIRLRTNGRLVPVSRRRMPLLQERLGL